VSGVVLEVVEGPGFSLRERAGEGVVRSRSEPHSFWRGWCYGKRCWGGWLDFDYDGPDVPP
jgi:hypothetical protein